MELGDRVTYTGFTNTLGAYSSERLLPDVPSFAELGMGDFVLPDASVGVFILSSMPKPVRDRIRQEMEKS